MQEDRGYSECNPHRMQMFRKNHHDIDLKRVLRFDAANHLTPRITSRSKST